MVRGAKPRAISDGPRIDPAFTNATVAESCHLTVWNPRLLHLRARGFAPLTENGHSSLFREQLYQPVVRVWLTLL
jgi:hypothetical protein